MGAPEQISPELVERMIAHFRAVDAKYANITSPGSSAFNAELAEVRAIVAELPKPVDPDLIEARALAASIYDEDGSFPQFAADLVAGNLDGSTECRTALAALKRGRELALAARS